MEIEVAETKQTRKQYESYKISPPTTRQLIVVFETFERIVAYAHTYVNIIFKYSFVLSAFCLGECELTSLRAYIETSVISSLQQLIQ